MPKVQRRLAVAVAPAMLRIMSFFRPNSPRRWPAASRLITGTRSQPGVLRDLEAATTPAMASFLGPGPPLDQGR